jgi:hypothetical protein
MKPFLVAVGLVLLIALAAFGYFMIDVDQTKEAKLPDVDVQVEGGQLPEYEVETGSVEITTETKEVTVPDVDISATEKEITVPTLDVKPAGE